MIGKLWKEHFIRYLRATRFACYKPKYHPSINSCR